MPQEFFVVPITHVDLAWKRGRDEMNEMLEIVVIRLLDALESESDFKYQLEQATLFRDLQKRRPDLIERLRPYLQTGRLEMVGGMASTLDVNIPQGESLIRNQQIGLKWVRDNWDVEVNTGWLVDTFGLHAQIPQIMRQFGMKQLVASRCGGAQVQDLFTAHGLDGSEITIVSWNDFASYVHPENISMSFCQNWDDIERCFSKADALRGSGPFMVVPYTENQFLVSLRPLHLTRERHRQRENQSWQMATPREYFKAVARSERPLPVLDADLNPEFTGCFSLRQQLRLRNRTVENRLLEAEKWTALAGLKDVQSLIEEAWWQLAFVQFHDVLTGSHPHWIYQETLQTLDEVEVTANHRLERAVSALSISKNSSDGKHSFAAVNSLPFPRRAVVEIELPTEWKGVAHVTNQSGEDLPFEVRDGKVRTLTDFTAGSLQMLHLESGNTPVEQGTEVLEVELENEYLRLELSAKNGVARLVWKATGAVLLQDVGALLVAQADNGNFQIESPNGAELGAELGEMRLESLVSPLAPRARLSGMFPNLRWAGQGNFLTWAIEFSLLPNRPEVDLKLKLQWKGEASRLRLRIATTLDTSTGIYEIPFGVVRRTPYTSRANAKGEWPAQRFVAIEDGTHGMALLNTGVAGVEVNGGTLLTTLLRAPQSAYIGMIPDESSSMHGEHEFHFLLAPYAGTWSEAGITALAQQLNFPPLTFPLQSGGVSSDSLFALSGPDASHVVLSCIKAAEDQSGDLVVRVYETTGSAAQIELFVRDASACFRSNLTEIKGEPICVENSRVPLQLAPFEIGTVRIVQSLPFGQGG